MSLPSPLNSELENQNFNQTYPLVKVSSQQSNPLATKNFVNENSSLYSLSQNYLIRQGFNYATIIIIQITYLSAKIIMKN